MRTKRILSIALTLAVLLGLLPGISLTASAEGNTTEITPTNTSGTMTITLVIQEMQASADDVSVTYDGQPHGITVNVTDPASGSTVKYGTAEGTYDLDASPTQTEVGTLTVYYQVTADNYVTKTGSATVTISKADAAAATVTADNRTYDGTDKPLVTVDNTTLVGGSMQYALGTETEATGDFTATIPSKTDAGTYYVWYKVAGDGNHNDYTATAPVAVTIARANASATAPTALNLTYTGQAQALVVAGSTNDGEMQYSLDGVSYSATIPTGTEAKTYSVWYKVVGDSNHNDTEPAHFDVIISEVKPVVSAPDTLTYTGEAQALVTGGSVTGGELQYALGEDDENAPQDGWSTTVPTGTDAGDYFVWYRIKGDANHNDVPPACIEISIAKSAITPAVSITGWTYGETANAPSVDGNLGGGEVSYTYSDAADGTFTATVPSNAGTWFVKATVAETGNYLGATTDPLSFAIAKASITPTVSITGWTYGESANAPSVDGNPGGGEVSYTYSDKRDGTYSATVPTNAGTWYVKATVAETDNYGGETSAATSFAIVKASITPTVSLTGWTYGEAANAPSVTGNTGNGEVTYAYAAKGGSDYSAAVPTAAGDYTVKATISATDNYNGGEATADFAIAKAAITPTVSITGWTYGQTANAPSVTGNTGNGAVTYEYSDQKDGTFTATVPTNAGTWYVKATVAETDNYLGATT